MTVKYPQPPQKEKDIIAWAKALTAQLQRGSSESQSIANLAAQVSAVRALPIGGLAPFAGQVAPAGFLICDGTSYEKSVYTALHAAIGDAWKLGGDPVEQFRVPDLRGRTPTGLQTGQTFGEYSGADQIQILQTNLPNVNFNVNDPSHLHGVSNVKTLSYSAGIETDDVLIPGNGYNSSPAATGITVNSGGAGTPISFTPRRAVMLWIIRAI